MLFFPRRTVDELEYRGKRIPAGTLLFWSPYLTHRSASLFPQPDAFLPERWDPARGKDVAPSTALVGFGGGPRICLGKAFALLQLRVVLYTLLSRYVLSFHHTSAMKVVQIPTYRPKDARLVFAPRR